MDAAVCGTVVTRARRRRLRSLGAAAVERGWQPDAPLSIERCACCLLVSCRRVRSSRRSAVRRACDAALVHAPTAEAPLPSSWLPAIMCQELLRLHTTGCRTSHPPNPAGGAGASPGCDAHRDAAARAGPAPPPPRPWLGLAPPAARSWDHCRSPGGRGRGRGPRRSGGKHQRLVATEVA